MSKIKKIEGRKIIDGRGKLSLEVRLILDNGLEVKASAPSGIYFNTFEPKESPGEISNDLSSSIITRSIDLIATVISPALKNQDPSCQEEIDDLLLALDGTEDLSRFGTKTIFAISIACARAAALVNKQELFVYLGEKFSFSAPKQLPRPIFTMFNGGLYADTNLDFQEYLLVTKDGVVNNNITMGCEIYESLGQVLRENGFDSDTGVEGAYAPNMDSSIQAMEMIRAAAINSGYQLSRDFSLGIDIGASLFFNPSENKYIFSADQQLISQNNLAGIYQEWFSMQGVDYLEDPLTEERFADWRDLTAELGEKVLIVGDDLFSSSSARLRRGLKEKAANAMVVKPVQAGTLTEAINVVKLAKKFAYQVIISARGGETNDDFIADFAVATGADWLKAGAPAHGDRVAKYNRLLEIESICQQNQRSKK